MKLAVVVHGRFHAFDLVRALLRRGNDVTVFTNYPRWAVKRFGLPPDRVYTYPLHGVLSRLAGRIQDKTGWSLDRWMHPMFARWAVSMLFGKEWDVIHAWTGVAEEIYTAPAFKPVCKLVMRGSAHIRTQAALLAEETVRAGHRIDHPSEWMIQREQREYQLADKIVVLSTFAYNSFCNEGIPESKLLRLLLGADTSAFRPTPATVEARRQRILSGAPLRVLYIGGICYRKGLIDLQQVVEQASTEFQFRFLGPVWEEATSIVASMQGPAEFIPKKPQKELPPEYAWGDVFIFPTVEDGYAAVLAQASAAALPVLTTTNGAGPDLLRDGRTGWVLPIRDAQAFLDKLRWCDSHRAELAGMVTAAFSESQTRDWADVAADFEAMCKAAAGKRTGSQAEATPAATVNR